jgi:periplasmic protein CpxP/Spy
VIRENANRKTLSLSLAAVAAAALLVAAPLVAQPSGPAGGPGDDPGFHHGFGRHGGGPGFLGDRGAARLARHLELTDEQRTEARAIHQAARDAVRPIVEESRTLRGELRGLLEQSAPSATAVGEKAIALHANRDEVRAVFAGAKADFEALLTPAQLDKLRTLEERRQDRRDDRREERRGRRGGGPGGGAAS